MANYEVTIVRNNQNTWPKVHKYTKDILPRQNGLDKERVWSWEKVHPIGECYIFKTHCIDLAERVRSALTDLSKEDLRDLKILYNINNI